MNDRLHNELNELLDAAPDIISEGGCVGFPLSALIAVMETVTEAYGVSFIEDIEREGIPVSDLEDLLEENPLAMTFLYFRGRFRIALHTTMADPELISELFPSTAFLCPPPMPDVEFEEEHHERFDCFDSRNFEEGEQAVIVRCEDSCEFNDFLYLNGYTIYGEESDGEYMLYTFFGANMVMRECISEKAAKGAQYIFNDTVFLDIASLPAC